MHSNKPVTTPVTKTVPILKQQGKAGWLWCLAVLGWLLAGPVAAAVTIDSVRLYRARDHTRIVFDLPGKIDYSLDKLANPDRVVVDLQQAVLDFNVGTLEYGDSPIKDIRVGKHPDKTRVVFD
ncbi:AMIN domain-containing protein, partial [Acinetobacter baumannii]|uniref:AMIN domain-containing protein n=1 Tax=Acinetobacter baumannii TaxID=470 RepID=UPI00189B78DF